MSSSVSQIQTLNVGPGIVCARPVGGNVPGIVTPWEYEALQDFSCDLDQKIVTAFGQGKLPFDSATTDMSMKGTISTLSLSGGVLANGSFGDGPTVGATVVESYREAYALSSTAISTRTASEAVTVGQFISDGTNIQIYITAGTTAASAPTWKTAIGETTTDGTAVAICAGPVGSITALCIVTVEQAEAYSSDLNVMYQSNNVQLANVASAPAVTQYAAIGSGVYVFNTADAGNPVFITYEYTSSTLGNTYPILQHTQGYGPILELDMRFPYQAGGPEVQNLGIFLTAVRIGKVSIKTKRDGYMTVSYDFEAFCPPNGVAGYLYLPS